MRIISGIFFAVFILLGIMFHRGHGAFLIAGYNTMPKDEKEQIDEKKMCRYVGKLMFAFAGCFLVFAAGSVLKQTWLLWLGVVLIVLVAVGGVLYINTGDRLKK